MPQDRTPTQKVKNRKQRKVSSAAWLDRHINDPYVHAAQRDGYRSRAAYKLLEIDEKCKILKPHQRVVDLGAAPGGWCQILVQKKVDKIVAIDLLAIDKMEGVEFLQMDFMAEDAVDTLTQTLGGKVDVVLSDMAPNTTGHAQTDHLRIMNLVEAAYEFAVQILKPDGAFVSKVFQGGAGSDFVTRAKRDFKVVKHIKPPASRAESAEIYLVAMGFRGS
jgi:23S rRNA (uridine2552-2'-O)-methyltransferase